LNYSHRPATTGRGPISNNADKTLGLHLPSLLAFTPPRQPLGLLDVQCWARDPARSSGAHGDGDAPLLSGALARAVVEAGSARPIAVGGCGAVTARPVR
jgi:hypothetical protein